MTCLTSKLIISIALTLLVQCNKTEAGSLSDTIQSILDVLKSIKNILKDDSIGLDSQTKHNSVINRSQNGHKDLLSTSKNVNLSTNDTLSVPKLDEENKYSVIDSTNAVDKIERTSMSEKRGNLNMTPKMRIEIQRQSDEKTELDKHIKPTGNNAGKDELTENESISKDENKNESESNNDNNEISKAAKIAARLFEESDEYKI